MPQLTPDDSAPRCSPPPGIGNTSMHASASGAIKICVAALYEAGKKLFTPAPCGQTSLTLPSRFGISSWLIVFAPVSGSIAVTMFCRPTSNANTNSPVSASTPS
jgi:hypothetical protein